jgi:putative transposase
MIDRAHELPLAAQCRLLGVARGCAYYRPVPVSEADLRLMRRIDERHLAFVFFGSRRLPKKLRGDGFDVGRRHLATLMRRPGIEALHRKPRTSQPNRQHRIYPHLLKDVAIARPNQIWAADITSIPMARGFGYLMAIIDLFSRKVLANRLSDTMTVDFCVTALQAALARFGTSEIFNTDQGAQFTDTDFTDTLAAHGVAISMDDAGALDRQRIHRAAVALGQVRGRLSARLRVAGRGAARAGGVLLPVQRRPPASGSRVPHPGRGALHRPGGGRKGAA